MMKDNEVQDRLKANLQKNLYDKVVQRQSVLADSFYISERDKKMNEIYDKIDDVDQFNKYRCEIFGDKMQADIQEITRAMKRTLVSNNEKNQPRRRQDKRNLSSGEEIDFDMCQY